MKKQSVLILKVFSLPCKPIAGFIITFLLGLGVPFGLQAVDYRPTRAIAPTLEELPIFMEDAYQLGLCHDSMRWANMVTRSYSNPLGTFAIARCEADFGQYDRALKTLLQTNFTNTPSEEAAHNLKGHILLMLAEKAQFMGNIKESEALLRRFFNEHQERNHPRYAYLMRRQARLQVPEHSIPARVPLRVGALLPLSGPMATVGKSMENALMLKLFGTPNPIELYPEDTSGTEEGTKEAFTRLLSAGVDLIVGPVLSQNVQAVAPLADGANLPLLAYSSDQNAQIKKEVHLFSILPAEQAKLMARYAVDRLGLRLFAALVPENAYGKLMLQAFKEELNRLGATLTRSTSFDLKNPDIKRPLRYLTRMAEAEKQIKDELSKLEEIHSLLGSAMDDADLKRLEFLRKAEAQPIVDYQALFVPAPADAMPLIASQLAFYDSDGAKIQLLGSAQWDSPTLLKDSQSYLKYALYPATPPKDQENFEKAFLTAFQTRPHPLASLAYDSLSLITHLTDQGLEKGKDLSKYMQRLGAYHGVTGPYQILPNNTLRHGYSVMQLRFRRGALQARTAQEAPFSLPLYQGGIQVSEDLPTFQKQKKKKSFWGGIFGD